MVVQMALVYSLCTLLEGLLCLPAIEVFDLKLPLVLGNYDGLLCGSYSINSVLIQLFGLSKHKPLLGRSVPMTLDGLIRRAGVQSELLLVVSHLILVFYTECRDDD
jgi:hypothetical protein